jgi:hypothetical protein
MSKRPKPSNSDLSDLSWPINVPATNGLVRADSWSLEQEKLLFQLVLTIGTWWVEIGKALGLDESKVKNRYYSALRRIERAHMVSSQFCSELLRGYSAKCTTQADEALLLPLATAIRKTRIRDPTPTIRIPTSTSSSTLTLTSSALLSAPTPSSRVISQPSPLSIAIASLSVQTLDRKRSRSAILPSPSPPPKFPNIEQSYTRSGQVKTATLESITAFVPPLSDSRPRQLAVPPVQSSSMSTTVLSAFTDSSTVSTSGGKRVQFEDPVVFSPYSKGTGTCIAPPLKFNDPMFVQLLQDAYYRVTGKQYAMQPNTGGGGGGGEGGEGGGGGGRGEEEGEGRGGVSRSTETIDLHPGSGTGDLDSSTTPRSLIPQPSHRSRPEEIRSSSSLSQTWIPPWADVQDSLESSSNSKTMKSSTLKKLSAKKTAAIPKALSMTLSKASPLLVKGTDSTIESRKPSSEQIEIAGGPKASPVDSPRKIFTSSSSSSRKPIASSPQVPQVLLRAEKTSLKRSTDVLSSIVEKVVDASKGRLLRTRSKQQIVEVISDETYHSNVNRGELFLPTFSPAISSFPQSSPQNPDYRLSSTPVLDMRISESLSTNTASRLLDSDISKGGIDSDISKGGIMTAPLTKKYKKSLPFQLQPETELDPESSHSDSDEARKAISTLLGLGSGLASRDTRHAESTPFSPSMYFAHGVPSSEFISTEPRLFSPMPNLSAIRPTMQHFMTPGAPLRRGNVVLTPFQKSPYAESPWALSNFESSNPLPPPPPTNFQLLASPLTFYPTPTTITSTSTTSTTTLFRKR